MYFVLQTPSLQHIVLVKIMAQLWTQKDIFIQTANLPDYDRKRIEEEKMKSKIQTLQLPEQFKKQLLTLIKPMRMEINHWCMRLEINHGCSYHCEGKIKFKFFDNLLPNQLCWSMHGSIDYAKTAKLMLKNEIMSIEKRYEIACINCLEDEAGELFESMSEERRQEYVSRVKNFTIVDEQHLIVFFTCTLSNDVGFLHKYFLPMMLRSGSTSLNKYLFQAMLPSGNRATFQYLFNKLNELEKEQVFKKFQEIIISSKYSSSTSNLMYYLSLMNTKQQERVFQECPVDLLKCFLRWPLQSLFVEAAGCGWQFMDTNDRTDVLRAIIFKIAHDLPDYDYCQLFWECWHLIPECLKQHFLRHDALLKELLLTKQEDIVKLVFKETPLRQILELCKRNLDLCNVLMEIENPISEAALRECKETAIVQIETRMRRGGLSNRSFYWAPVA